MTEQTHEYPRYVKRQTERLHIRLDEKTAYELDRLTQKTNLNKSEVIRRSIHIMNKKTADSNIAMKDFLQKNSAIIKALSSLNATLNAIQLDYRRIGSNLNQIAKKANADDLSGIQEVNSAIGEDLEKIKQSIDILVRRLYE